MAGDVASSSASFSFSPWPASLGFNLKCPARALLAPSSSPVSEALTITLTGVKRFKYRALAPPWPALAASTQMRRENSTGSTGDLHFMNKRHSWVMRTSVKTLLLLEAFFLSLRSPTSFWMAASMSPSSWSSSSTRFSGSDLMPYIFWAYFFVSVLD